MGPQLNQNFQKNEQLTGDNQKMRTQKKNEQEKVSDKKVNTGT